MHGSGDVLEQASPPVRFLAQLTGNEGTTMWQTSPAVPPCHDCSRSLRWHRDVYPVSTMAAWEAGDTRKGNVTVKAWLAPLTWGPAAKVLSTSPCLPASNRAPVWWAPSMRAQFLPSWLIAKPGLALQSQIQLSVTGWPGYAILYGRAFRGLLIGLV